MRSRTNYRFATTYFDGIGRPIKAESSAYVGGFATVRSIVETQYEGCDCSPAGMMKRVNLPYAPGGSPIWTEYTYDGLGRTVSVAEPNNAGTTTYLYQGKTVKVTSPSGQWKTYEMDALGLMTQVTEPRPGGGTYSTSYAYNIAGKSISVSMPRDGVTQTRTFAYDAATQSSSLSATNPENGTVTYVYKNDPKNGGLTASGMAVGPQVANNERHGKSSHPAMHSPVG